MNNDELLTAMSDMMDARDERLQKSMSDMMDVRDERLQKSMSDMMDKKLDARDERLTKAMSDMMDEKLDARDERLTKTMSDMMDEKLDARDERLEKSMSDMMKTMSIKVDVADLRTRVTKLEVDNETVIIPGINELRAAYNSEFDKYQVSIQDHERLVTEVDVLNTVVPHHSEQIAELQQVCGL